MASDKKQQESQADDIQMYKDEIEKYKQYMNVLSQENHDLKKSQDQHDKLLVQEAQNNEIQDDASLNQQLIKKEMHIKAMQRKLKQYVEEIKVLNGNIDNVIENQRN